MNQLLQQVSYELATAFLPNSAEKKQLNSNAQSKSIAPHKASTYLHCLAKKGRKKVVNTRITPVRK